MTPADAGAVAVTLAGAFFNDPVWGWAFPDPAHRYDQHVAFWGLFVDGSVEHGWVWTTEDFGATSVWIPPGMPDLTEPHASRLEPLIDELLGDRGGLVVDVLDRFDAAHPHHEPHYYLSLLGTHPDQRGRGIGMELLRSNLAEIDRQHEPSYLESTNPANLARYESVGFEVIGEFELPQDGPRVTQMWRTAQSARPNTDRSPR